MDLERTVNSDPRRNLPSVDRVIHDAKIESPNLADWALLSASRDVIQQARDGISRGDRSGESLSMDALVGLATIEARRLSMRHPRAVINATGILLHTNLGRAPLSVPAQAAVAEAARGYSNLELDLETGRRGSRMGRLEAKLVALSGAEAAHVVNNNAAAVLLALNTLALGRSVVVSRGELVEIGGSFRVPAIMERSGVQLAEIGTTNRTHLSDYAEAIGPETALLLRVHRSNFEQRGFVAEPEVGELATLAKDRGIVLVEDLGSGTLLDLGGDGLPEDAFAPARLALGVDVVCFSGDKLIGGPQAGILLGRSDLIDAMRRNPLTRALRVDKLTVAALDATLDLLLDPSRSEEIPVVAGLRVAGALLKGRARELLARLSPLLESTYSLGLRESETPVGGGSLPEHRLSGWAVVVTGSKVTMLAARLREAPTPVLVRVHDDAIWLDVRTLRDDDFPALLEAFSFALA
ncbi:MAG: L-seryl-tRNA(Sec) selenium transferase [Proteobacteria bacterium]|nr:L-seryl-tRNA(Sec) selenium transferase [Pseudomonadota bacterium]